MTDPHHGAAAPADPAEGGSAASGVSRRSLLGFGGAGLAALAAGFAGGLGTGRATAAPAAPAPASDVVPFHGTHQAGIATRAQDRLHFATFDLTTTSRDDLVDLLQRWTVAAERMTRGLPAGELGPVSGPYEAPPDDTGEAQELSAANLTITFGFGPSLFDDRFGLADRRPALLEDLPHFPGDMLEDARTGGDLAVQACADDPQVAVHAIRNLARIAFGTAQVRWSQLGYGRTSRTSQAQATPRNLFGFKDGTANILAEDAAALDEHVWVAGADDPDAAWLAGGSYLVARRIRMNIETWDRGSLHEQETIIGRTKGSGAPLSGGKEGTEPDFARQGNGGQPLIDPASHVAMAHPDANGGVRMLRRGYNYTDGSDGLGRLDAGLFFLAFVRNPATHYVPMQNALAKNDLLSEYLRHTGSGLWAVPPGTRDGGWVGQALFDS
ncbi:iron uptake transporter deferrochelatase/peroxidase subunit [Xylanimonas protaetiae]|uniref:Deferrochelatase n=1 Tax=Xylanimonas protaetiae TaxID=2509457 RepID=A0A4P6FAD7_9MICO|nr:iron uptake transporter deferrochelatase/peroxidase subunit [Xylanimonas protaetiae]QAY70357.1 deferrochelatase/peroxidase EfeB [Xylanimonas protaetiae]